MTLVHLQRIKQWHVAHRHDHPVEYHLFDLVLTVWVMGWIGWLPALLLEAVWAVPLCLAAIGAPHLYARWRRRAHHAGRLRCDWLPGA